MKMLFIEYPKCSTCRKAKAWRVEKNPTKEELSVWIARSGLPVKRFFNTSGMKYKELGLKDRLADMSMEEQLSLLASDGMLVKRPLLVGENFVIPGFKEKEWISALGLEA